MYIYDELGVKRKISHLQAADKLFEIKKKSGSSPWPVIDECFKIFEKEHPRKYDSYLFYLEDVKATRKDKFASTKDPVTGGYLRYTVDMPVKVHKMIRAVYSPQELSMNDKEFWIEFARRYTKYRVAEKI